MKSILAVVLMLVSLTASALTSTCAVDGPYFSPRGGTTKQIVTLLDATKSKDDVLVSAYRLTSSEVISALIRADKRGARVQVITDDSELISNLQLMNTIGIEVYEDGAHAIHHNKYIVINRLVVETGSFNYSYAAEYSNAENALILKCRSVANLYADNFEKHKLHSVRVK